MNMETSYTSGPVNESFGHFHCEKKLLNISREFIIMNNEFDEIREKYYFAKINFHRLKCFIQASIVRRISDDKFCY